MIVYVESNFVLEIALGQEEAPAAETILELAENNKLELCCPGFSLSEPFATITQRGRKREDLGKSLTGTLRELQRSKPHEEVVSKLQSVPAILTNIAKKEFSLLQLTVKRLLGMSKLIELNGVIYEQAIVLESYNCQYVENFNVGLILIQSNLAL